MLVNVDQIQTVQGTSSGENLLILIPSVYLLEAFCSCGFQGISPAWIFPWLLLPHPFCWILLTSPHPDHRVHLIQSLAWFILSCFFFLPTLICKWSHSFSPYLPTISFILMASNAIYMLIIPKHITELFHGFQAHISGCWLYSNRHLRLDVSTTEFPLWLPPLKLFLPLSSPSQLMATQLSRHSGQAPWSHASPLFLSYSVSANLVASA